MIKVMIDITDNRLSHIKKVADFMYNTMVMARASEKEARNMYVLGFLHDIGYRFTTTDDKTKHPYIGAAMVDGIVSDEMKMAILYHGCPYEDVPDACRTKALDLLNWADMNISSKGIYVGTEKRLNDIMERYGENSSQYINAVKIIDYLQNKYQGPQEVPIENI